jgi:enoyl-CoA hydratase
VIERLTPAVHIERLCDHIAIVTIDRPEARNAVNADVAAGLEAAVDSTESDPDIWVSILTGTGNAAFCAGADLKDIAAGKSVRTERGGFAGFTFRDRTKPWIAAVNGKALAGGTELVLACDLVVAAEHATFGLPEVLRSLIASAGGLYRLPRAIPPKVALELILTAGQLEASRALHYGLVNRLVPGDGVRAAAIGLATEITRNAPLAVRESLSIAKRAYDGDEELLRSLSLDASHRIRQTEDFTEGPRSFIEKRPPNWAGR